MSLNTTQCRAGLSEIVDMALPGIAQLSQLMEKKIAKFSKPTQDEIYGRFHALYKKTMDPVRGLALLQENNEYDKLLNIVFEVAQDVETSNKIMMKFKQSLPKREILELYAGLSAKGKERISKELQKTLAEAKYSELEVAFEKTFGKMDPATHLARHLFVLQNIQDEAKGISFVKKHLDHLDPIFQKDLRNILKKELHCKAEDVDAQQWSRAAGILIKDLQSSKKSSNNEKTAEKADPETEIFQSQLILLGQIESHRGAHSTLTGLIGQLNKQTTEKFKDMIYKLYRISFADSRSEQRQMAAGELLKELKAAQTSSSSSEKTTEKEGSGAQAKSQLEILEQIKNHTGSDVSLSILISELDTQTRKQLQERVDKSFQVTLKIGGYDSSSDQKRQVAGILLAELKASQTSSSSSEKTAEKGGLKTLLQVELEVIQGKLDILQQIKDENELGPAKKLRDLLDGNTKAQFDAALKDRQGVTLDTATFIDFYSAASYIHNLCSTLKKEKTEQLEKLKQIKPDSSMPAIEKKTESEAKPAFDAVKEIKRLDTQLEGLQLLIKNNGKLHLIPNNTNLLDKNAEDDLDLILKENFMMHFANATDDQMIAGAEILVKRYRFERQIAILRDIAQTNGSTDSKNKIDIVILGTFDDVCKIQVGVDYLDITPSDLAKAANIYLEKHEAQKVKERQWLQNNMDALAQLIRNEGNVSVSDNYYGTCVQEMDKILKGSKYNTSWDLSSPAQTCDAAKTLLRKYLTKSNPISQDWQEAGIKDLTDIINNNGKVFNYPHQMTIKNLDEILLLNHGVVLQRYTQSNNDAQVLAAAKTLLRRYEALTS